jgi:predicted MFS family arabinose efflux permease
VVGSALGGFIVQHYGYRTLFSRYALFALASLLLTLIFSKTMRQEPLESV